MTLTATVPTPAPLLIPAADLPLWLVTMPTSSPTGTRGEQTFAVRALTYAEALTTAATTAHAHPALRHRRGARIDTAAARATLHH
ncbi:hypothetical protein ACFC6L_20830 [Kitasatospora phosalacinea]|uniref:hypothetical protein n=1 Tax=Kitasatospora phosalacinea TaxID=2065 RepID=UPI0035DCACB3